MDIIKRDVNFVFFILIIAVVIAFAGFTAYYQTSFRNINEEYNSKLAELNRVTRDLLEKKAVLLETNLELNTTKQGREELVERYDDLREERDNLIDDRNKYRDNYFKTKSELDLKVSEVASLSAQLEASRKEAENYKADKEHFKQKYETCKQAAEDLGGSC